MCSDYCYPDRNLANVFFNNRVNIFIYLIYSCMFIALNGLQLYFRIRIFRTMDFTVIY